ncbi:MAG: hypothetical protein J7578_17525 [Chitinophagaceae bacterium]|nr:hypothetical protein [Chitinophagaceae bacterium]
MKKQLPILLILIPVVNCLLIVKAQFAAQRVLFYLLTDSEFTPLRCFSIIRFVLYTLASLVMMVLPIVFLLMPEGALRKKIYAVVRYIAVISCLVGLPEWVRQSFVVPFADNWPYILGALFFLYASFIIYNVKPEKDIPLIVVQQYPIVAHTSTLHRAYHLVLDTLFLLSATYTWDPYFVFAISPEDNQVLPETGYLLFQIILFYFLSELLFRQTFTKIFTNSCVAGTNGPPVASKILWRTLSRLIPLEALSFLFGGNFHDQFSGTTVVYNGSWKDMVFEDEEVQLQQQN